MDDILTGVDFKADDNNSERNHILGEVAGGVKIAGMDCHRGFHSDFDCASGK